MKTANRACPIGDGWTETATGAGEPWKRQWKHETGVIRRDYGEYVEIIHPSGWRQYSGDGGGRLVIQKDGEVIVHWNRAAALAAFHGSGNRKNRITKANGKRTPPLLDETFGMIAGIRDSFISSKGECAPEGRDEVLKWDVQPNLPWDFDSPQAFELLKTFHREAYHVLSAIVKGDAGEIRRIAAAVDNHEGIRTGRLETSTEPFSGIAKAIKNAVIKKGGIPSRPDIIDEYTRIGEVSRDELSMEAYREKFGRMGFAWLHALHGKRGKKREG